MLLGYRLGDERNQVFDIPNVVSDSSFHRWSHAERLMHPNEVVVSEVQRNRMAMILSKGKARTAKS